MNTKLWSTWLTVTGIAMTVLGLAMIFLYATPAFDLARDGVNGAFWNGPVPPAAELYGHWMHAVLGSVLAGWGAMFALVAAIPFRRGERWAWWAITGSATGWFVLDTAASLHFGVLFNAGLNAVMFVCYVIPIAGSARSFLAPRA